MKWQHWRQCREPLSPYPFMFGGTIKWYSFWKGKRAMPTRNESVLILDQQFCSRNPSWENTYAYARRHKETNEFMGADLSYL